MQRTGVNLDRVLLTAYFFQAVQGFVCGTSMTLQEQSVANDRMLAEIARLVAKTSEINQNMNHRYWVRMPAFVSRMGDTQQVFLFRSLHDLTHQTP
jgi:hypothetical protein